MNLTNFTDGMGTFQGVAYQANVVTGGVLFNGAIVVFFVIILMALLKFERPFEEAITVSAWSMFLVSGLFWFAHLCVDMFPIAFFIIAILGTLYLFSSRQ